MTHPPSGDWQGQLRDLARRKATVTEPAIDMPPSCWARPDQPDHVGCSACFAERHIGHDVGWRHEGGRLDSATCHDCKETFGGE